MDSERFNNGTIKEGDHVILQKEKNMKLFQVRSGRDVWLEKSKFTLNGILGHPYGTTFEVKNGQMVKCAKKVDVQSEEPEQSMKDTDLSVEKDNRNLYDTDSNQKLSRDEIEKLKKEGVTGDKLIEHLIENSATFQDKTEYSQAKYVKKKKKKHLLEFTVLKPTTRLLCEMHCAKGPGKICNMRVDSLAQMMTLGNVRANSTVAVVDSCQGLVTGAVLERLGGFGRVINFYSGNSQPNHVIEAYDFSKEVMDSVYSFPLNQINSLKHGKPGAPANRPVCVSPDADSDVKESMSETVDKTQAEDTEVSVADTSPQLSDQQQTTQPEQSSIDKDESVKNKKGGKSKKRPTLEDRVAAKQAREREIGAARNVILEKNIDCLLVASKYHPTPIITALLDYMSPSRQVVIFCQFKEALMDCYVYLREQGGLVNYRLTETWLREYQVLPNRTHPVIQMSGNGGYLLTATTVIR